MGTARDSYLCWEGHAHNICVCASACMRACTHRSELGGSRRWFSFACGQLFFLHLQVLSVWDNTSTPSLTKTPHKEPRAGGCVLFNATVRCRPKTWIPGDPARFYVHHQHLLRTTVRLPAPWWHPRGSPVAAAFTAHPNARSMAGSERSW